MSPSKHAVVILVLAGLGCAKPRFTYEVDPSFKAGSYRTMAADPRRDRIIIREGMRPLNPELHLKAALADLEARHFQPAPVQEADLWVAVYVLIGGQPGGGTAHREGAGEGHRGGGRGGAGSSAAPARPEGDSRGAFTIIVQLEDRRTGLPVWHGEARLDHKTQAAGGGPIGVEESVRLLLQPLPAQP